ncbi:hypothetical protein EI94DRAFT_1809631 [Lactarius quietus]|nr:hypothetical protein EI94DRAFT_1809631 [Lactarius quietus]
MPKPSLTGKLEKVISDSHTYTCSLGISEPLRVDEVAVTLRTCLTEQDLRDLLVIWGRDQRIPTPSSRHKWAQHRGLAPSTVGGWFNRRRARHIRLQLNPSSPSNVAPHEIPEKVQVRGSRARARARASTERGATNLGSGSERTDPDQSSDDPAFNHPDQEADMADASETAVIMDFSSEPSTGLLCRGDSPPSPPTLRLPWSMQAETAERAQFGLSETGALELSPTSSLRKDLDNGQRPLWI